MTPTPFPATDKQLSFIKSLKAERGVEDLATDGLSKQEASALIDTLLGMPKIPKAKAAPVVKSSYDAKKGDVHFVDGDFYRVHIGQNSGHAYAVKAIVWGEAQWNEDGSLDSPAEVEWDLAKGMIFKLSDDTTATAAQSKQFATLVGRCVFCSHEIDTPESTTAGYGPSCAKRYALPWGKTLVA